MSGYGNRGGDTHVESWCDPQTTEGWGGTQTNEGWGVLQLDEIGSLNAWMDNEEESWSGSISQEKNSSNRKRTEVATTQGSQNSAGRAFITNDQQKPKLQNNFRNQYKKLKSHDNYRNQEPYKTETHETRSKALNANHDYINANLQITTPETQVQVFDKRLLSSTLPPIVEEWEYNTSRWEDDVNYTPFDDTVKPITEQLSQMQISSQTSSQTLEPPKNDSQDNDVSNVENMEKCKEAKIEKSEEFLRDPQNKSKLNNDQLQSIEKKEQVIGAIKELEEIYKKIVSIDTEV
ncbi:14158_t:CDS:2 [Racocetra fulgida]|uniref:14158_t:CDS:1 n=1 Tax=Racocetra fulgida TaxID=60492 RepID=A0A9N8VJ70_9GLOM|nr:14158_t:CDS:2 [Racocetra fulgida]